MAWSMAGSYTQTRTTTNYYTPLTSRKYGDDVDWILMCLCSRIHLTSLLIFYLKTAVRKQSASLSLDAFECKEFTEKSMFGIDLF